MGLVAVSAAGVWATVGGLLDCFSSVIKLALTAGSVVVFLDVFAGGADPAERGTLFVFRSEDPASGALSEVDLFLPRSGND